jgi:peroxiredoxin
LLALLVTPLARAIEAGQVPPDFKLKTLSGQEISLSGLRGKVVILDFWASWCAPCKDEMPVLERLHKKYGSKGLVIVGISVDNELANAKKFIDGVKVTFPIVHDAKKSVADAYKPPRMPTSLVLDREGKVRFVHAGFRKEDAQKLEKEVAGLL